MQSINTHSRHCQNISNLLPVLKNIYTALEYIHFDLKHIFQVKIKGTSRSKAGEGVSLLFSVDWLVGWFELGKGEVRVKKIYDHSLLFWIKGHRWNHAFVQRQWQPTPVLLPGKSHGLRSLVGCSPWGRKESDMTEQLHFHFSRSCIGEGNGNPLQCSCLENPRDRGAWWAAFYGVAQSRTWLKQLSSSSSS